MSDMHADHRRATPELEGVLADLRADIALGHVTDDLSTVLRERLSTAGLSVPEEEIETIASDIEVESSH
jgi:hypothetical protein